MKLTEELLKEMEKKKELYGDGIIMPDGDPYGPFTIYGK